LALLATSLEKIRKVSIKTAKSAAMTSINPVTLNAACVQMAGSYASIATTWARGELGFSLVGKAQEQEHENRPGILMASYPAIARRMSCEFIIDAQ
jgi:hypothetical protein